MLKTSPLLTSYFVPVLFFEIYDLSKVGQMSSLFIIKILAYKKILKLLFI